MRVISTSYMAIVNETNKKLKAGDDASEACWFDLSSRIETVEDSRGGRPAGICVVYSSAAEERQEELSALCAISRWFKGSTDSN